MRPGAGSYPLRGHNNVQGVSDMGAVPDRVSGYQSIADPEVHTRFEKRWNATFPTTRGLDNHEMVDAILIISIRRKSWRKSLLSRRYSPV
jgi:formate dehydrogenase major subunit